MILRLGVFLGVMLVASQSAFADAWYEGGTLQKATVADWKNATPADQLATAADFIASLNAVPDIAAVQDQVIVEQIRKRSEDLKACINQSIQQPNVPLDKPVAEIVVVCTVMKSK